MKETDKRTRQSIRLSRLSTVLLGQLIHKLDISSLGVFGGDMADFLPGVVLVFCLFKETT